MTDNEARAIAAVNAVVAAMLAYVPMGQRDTAAKTAMAVAMGVLHGTMGRQP